MVKVSITAAHDGGNIEVISSGETVISGRTAKVTVILHIKPGKFGPGGSEEDDWRGGARRRGGGRWWGCWVIKR
jgi:hypothetical protein